MKRNQRKFLEELQMRMNKFVLELATISKMLEMCGKDCDCGCKLEQIESCGKDCDCGCKLDQTTMCGKDCDCGCQLEKVQSCGKDCDCGCKCDCGCQDQANAKDCESDFDFGGDDGDDGNDNDKKHEKECKCGCGHEHHSGKHHKQHHDCHCDEEKVQCDCEMPEFDCEFTERDCGEQQCQCGKPEIDYLALAQNIQADFDNYRKRTNGAVAQATADGKMSATTEFLPILDVVNKAISLVKDDEAKHGLELIKTSFEKALETLGVKAIEALGQHYDPNLHNVVLAMESDKESGTVVEELEKGYMFGDKVVKHSVVIVAK